MGILRSQQNPRSSINVPQNQGAGAATSSALCFDQDPLTLRFDAPEEEAEFVAYMHPTPLRVLPILYFALSFFFLIAMLQTPGIGYEILLGWFFISGVINLITNRVHKRNGAPWTLEVERQLLAVVILMTILLNHWVQLQHMETCDVRDETPIDDRRVFVEAHCHLFWSPFPTSGVVFATAMQVVLFPTILSLSVTSVLIYSLLWVFRPPKDMFVAVWLQVVYVAAGLAFVCFVRYDQEQSHRKMFIAHRQLQHRQRLLVSRQRSLAEYCTLVLPRSLLRRLHSGGSEMITALDRVEDGVALYVGIHECGVWFTQQQPLEAASAVVALHDMVRRVATQFQVDVVGTMGDAILCVANVSQPLPMAAQKMCYLASICVNGKRDGEVLPPLRLAAHSGPLEGHFAGTHFVRYAVRGPCMAAIQAAVLECGPGDIAASDLLVSSAMLPPRLPGNAEGSSTPGSSLASSLPGDTKSTSSDATRRFTCQGVAFTLVDFEELVPQGYDWSSNNASELSTELFDPSADVERLMAGLGDSMNAVRQQQYGRRPRPARQQQGPPPGNISSSPQQSPGIVAVVHPPSDDQILSLEIAPSDGSSGLQRADNGSQRTDEQQLLVESLSHSQAPEEDSVSHLKGHLGRFQATETVWCCFPKFADEAIERTFVEERIDELPKAASRTWFAYSAFVAVMLMLLIADFKGPYAIVGVFLLLLAVLLAIVMAVVPRCVSRATMRRLFFPWSVLGVSMPLLVLYGCAVSRPSAIGNDTKLFLLIGAVIRSYCFSNVRWQAVVVPLATLIGQMQYLLPGGLVRNNMIFVVVLVFVVILAELERERKYRENTRRGVEARLVVSQLQSLEWLREGLLRSVVPPEVFRLIRYRHDTDTTCATSHALQSEGTVMVLQADASNSPHIRALESLLVESKHLALASILGDQAVVVGPVVTTRGRTREKRQQENDGAVKETLDIALQLESLIGSRQPIVGVPDIPTAFGGAPPAQQQQQQQQHPPQRPAFSAVVDMDALVHVTKLGDYAQYWALGVTVTRLLTLVAAADPATLGGLLVTDRVVALATELGVLPETVTQTSTGPMKLRGVGMIRLTRLENSGDATSM